MRIKYAIITFTLVVILFGCSSNISIKNKAVDHDKSYISDAIIEAYQNNNYEKYSDLCDETIDAYSDILSDLQENGADSKEYESYKKDLEAIQANYQFLVSQYDGFTVNLDNLIYQFSNE